ncbi:hypothetical protein VTN77DRAFT_3912 [Rasamsonia byssochlamydoides]|uniref:uncharacterized protein n=1 Tax=Rasamsonia byssochlamydoides TaxID=89139 RepID=UPI0037422543
MFAPTFDHSFNDLFNQYVNMDPCSSGDGNKDVVSFTGDLDQLFPLGSLSSDCGDPSPIGSSSRHLAQSPSQLWCLQQDAVSPTQPQRSSAFHDTIQPSAISDFSLNPEDSFSPGLNLLSTSPSTPPVTPNRKVSSKSAIITPKSISRREPNDRRALLRKHSFSPSLMRSTHLQKTKMAYPEAWMQRLQNFNNLRGAAAAAASEDRLPLSPPPSDILVQHENMRRDSGVHMNLSTGGSTGSEGLLRDPEMPSQYNSHMFHQSSSGNSLAKQQQQGYLNQSTSSPPSADDLFHSPHSSESQQIPAWHADALGASGVSFTPDINGHDSQWWSSPMPTRVPHAPSQHPYQPMVVSSLAEKTPIHTVAHHNDLLQGGLMIQFGSPFDLPSAPESSFSSASGLHSTSAPHIPAAQHPTAFSPASSFMPTTNAQQQQQQPQQLHQHQSRSPSMSPTATTSPKSSVARGIKANNHRRTHSRKLSGQSTTAPKPATKLGGSPKSANKTMNVSFVNFTPEDSHKILTGVAPSGSSKTKARREQEAREKRRKLSEAALMAVRKAGGDVEALEAVLC